MSSPEKRADRLTQVQAQVDYHHQRLAELEHAYLTARTRLAGASGASVPAGDAGPSRG